jgi:hypothetical protein
MAQRAGTTAIEIDTGLLERLRVRHPGKGDREIIEGMAQVDLGFALLRQAQERNALDDEAAIEFGVRAVHKARRASS